MSVIRLLAVMIVVPLVLASCASNETAPSKVTAGDLLFSDRLDQYLAKRRGQLANLESRNDRLRGLIASQEQLVSDLDEDVREEERAGKVSAVQAAESREELDQKRAELDELRARLERLHSLNHDLNEAQVNADSVRRDRREIAGLQHDIEQLETDIEGYEFSIRLTARGRARRGLEE